MRDHTTPPETPAASNIEALKALIHEAELALNTVKEGHGANLDDIRTRLSEAIDQGRSMAADMGKTVRRQAAKADEAIRANPYPTIGVAAGVGLVVGLLISGRFRSHGPS